MNNNNVEETFIFSGKLKIIYLTLNILEKDMTAVLSNQNLY